MLPRLLTPKETYTIDYPQAIEFAEKQSHILWLPEEVAVEKDLQDITTRLTPSEKHGVTTVLKLFTLYETRVGDDYWSGYVSKVFPRPDIQRMAATFSYFELGIHAPSMGGLA